VSVRYKLIRSTAPGVLPGRPARSPSGGLVLCDSMRWADVGARGWPKGRIHAHFCGCWGQTMMGWGCPLAPGSQSLKGSPGPSLLQSCRRWAAGLWHSGVDGDTQKPVGHRWMKRLNVHGEPDSAVANQRPGSTPAVCQ
jgi:hypothetical protein